LRGAYDEAEEDFTNAIANNPKDASLYYERGRARQDQGKHGAAESDFIQAIALEAGQPEYYEMRALSRYEQGYMGESGARQDLTRAEALRKHSRGS